ncbi:quattro [Diretmus argenteus]
MSLQPPKTGQVPGKAEKRKKTGETPANAFEAKIVRNFLSKWTDEFPWVRHDEKNGLMFCSTCQDFPSKADRTSSLYIGTTAFRFDTLQSHGASKRHNHCMAAASASDPGAPIPAIIEGVQKMDEGLRLKMINIMHAAYYVAKEELPFTQFQSLHGLISRTGGKLPDCYDSDKACARFIVGIYDMERKRLLENINKPSYFTIIIDGATDSATLKNELIYIRYLSNDGPVNSFLSIEDVKNGNAAGVLDTIYAAFEEAGITDWRERLVGFGSDGAAVNVGCRSGVAARLKQDIGYLISIHCIAHRLELGVVKAIRANPKMEQMQVMLKHLYDQYHYSPKAVRELRLIAEALEEKVLKPSNLHGAHWLPYVHRATKIVCDSYPVFIAHFEDMASAERNPKPSPTVIGRAKQVAGYLKKYDNVLFLHFMNDVLSHLSTLSKVFQKDNITVCQAVESQEACFWDITSMKMTMGPQMAKVHQAVQESGEYKGVKLQKVTQSTLESERAEVIDSIITHLEERLADLQQGGTIAKFRALDPSSWPVCDRADPVAREKFMQAGVDDLRALATFYEELLDKAGILVDSVIAEYNQYKSYAQGRASVPMRELFMNILKSEETRERFRSLVPLMEVYLILPLFLMNQGALNTAGLSGFYTSVLRAWRLLKHTRVGGVVLGPWVWEEPIFPNPVISLESVRSALRQRLMRGGITKLGHMVSLGGGGWKKPQELSQQTGLTSLRLLGALPDTVRDCPVVLQGVEAPVFPAVQNPESLDSSIQSALSALFPPFEVTAPVVLSQLFRTIEDRYHGDALHCLLDFLIPSKHLLESVQQAACAAYSDVIFRCEGWPLCLHDKTVIQLAPLNPLLLRLGDFYLQVEPFGDQAARIVLKSLLEEGCREVEETPIPETSYPCIFSEDWLQDINEGRHGTPLSRCLLSTDQGIIKLPWTKIAIPEFLDKPKTMPTSSSVIHEAPLQPKRVSVPSHFNSSTLPMETMILPTRDRTSVSLRSVDSSSKLVKIEPEKPTPKSRSKPLIKPVGWVSPNTWDSRNYWEIEGDYVDLVDLAKEKEGLANLDSHPNPPSPILFKPVRPPPPVPVGNSDPCGRTLRYAEEPCTPCSQRKLGHEPTDQELKCRYRDSYLAALRNPLTFEKGSADPLAVLEEVGLCEGGEFGTNSAIPCQGDGLENSRNHCNEHMISHEPHQYRQCCDTTPANVQLKEPPTRVQSGNLMKELPTVHKLTTGASLSQEAQISPIPHQVGHDSGVHPIPDAPPLVSEPCDGNMKPHQMVQMGKRTGKHKVKLRSLSTVSETSKGSPLLHKPNNRSHSDICPEMIPSIVQKSQSSKSELPLTTDAPDTKQPNTKTDKPSSSQVQLASSLSDTPLSPQTEESSFRSISGLLQLGIICLPGGRDKTGRAVVEVHGDRKEWTSPLISAQDVCKLLLYLHSIPRKDVQDLGMTLVIDARKRPPPLLLYKALLMAQEQALHAVHSILMLVDKDTCPRPERQPGLQMDTVTSLKTLNKTVEGPQLTSDLGGTFTYSHTGWLQFHQRLVSFMTDLQGADKLLQKAIKKVECSQKMDTVQDVQLCIQEQRASMKDVLADVRLVTLQREGGAVLARMRREEFRFPHSEDYRDALESVTGLYNQVEEKLHTLVMRSNKSLQHLDFLFRLREMEGKISTAGTWFNTEGEQMLTDSSTADETLQGTEKALQHLGSFLTQAKEKQQYAMTLVMEAESIVDASDSTPAIDVFQTVVSTFKSNMDDFLLRAEQRYKELDTLVNLYRFCEQASALVKECSHYLELLEKGCYPAKASLSTLKMYEEGLAGEFSAPHFQAVKAKACAVGSRASGVMRVWNAAWVQCQEVTKRLGERRKKKGVDKNQNLQTTAAAPQGNVGVLEREEERSEAGEAGCSLTQESPSSTEVLTISERAVEDSRDGGDRECRNVTCSNLHFQPDLKGSEGGEAEALQLPERPVKDGKMSPVLPQNGDCGLETKWRPREHHSEVDLRRIDSVGEGEEFPWQQAHGRSHSEGSCVGARLTSISGASLLSARHNYCQSRTHPLTLQPIQNSPVSRNESFCSGPLSCEPNTDSNTEQGRPTEGPSAPTHSPKDLRTQEASLLADSNVLKLQRIMEELLSTEREYVRALGYVREHYFPELERADVPQDLRGQRGSIFGNLEKLHDFHRHHFLKELESCAKEPFRVGRCFLRHRESFALYALYSKNKPQSDSLLINHGQAFFKQKQQKLGDKMDLWSYLLKPVQRISKYSLLLQDMMSECGPGQTREIAEVHAALEVVHFQLRHGNNLLAMDDIHYCDVNLKEQGQLIRQDEFLVTFRKKKCFRHIFLFQDLILFSKTKKTDVGNDTYIYKQSFKTSDIGMTYNSGDSGRCFEIWFRRRKSQDTYILQAVSQEVKDAWTKDLERILWEQAVHNREVRMQERVFMGIGNKPFMDIQPSDAAINDRAVNYVLMGRGSLPPGGYLCGPKLRMGSGGLGGYVAPPGVLEEDDLDHESGSQNLLLDSSESSGESVSGFSSSGHSCFSAIGGEGEDTSSVCTSTITIKEPVANQSDASPDFQKPNSSTGAPGKTPPPVAPKPKHKPPYQTKDLPCGKVQNTIVGKSTEV